MGTEMHSHEMQTPIDKTSDAVEVENTTAHGQHDDSDRLSINEAALGNNLPPGYFYSAPFIGTYAGLTLGLISTNIIFVWTINILTYTNADIGPSASISWVSIARTLGQSVVFPIQGRLSDLFGRRWFYIGGSLVALVGIIVSATAKNVNTLIGASVIYGMGESILICYGVPLSELVAYKHRPIAGTGIALIAAPFSAFGPLIARTFIVRGLGWRWVYYLGLICNGLATILFYFFYHPPTFEMLHERKSKRKQLMQLDFIGMGIWIAGLCLFLLGLSWGGGLYAWNSAQVITTLVLGAVILIIFGLWESFANLKYPLMPMSLFRNRGYISMAACATISFMAYYTAILLWPQQVNALYTQDIIYGGWLSCTVGAGVLLGTVFGGLILHFGANSKYTMILTTLAMVGFVAALAALTPSTKSLGVVLSVLGPLMVGIIEFACLTLAPLFCNPEDLGLATGTLSAIRSAGASIAVSVYTTILTNRLTTTLTDNVGDAVVNAGFDGGKVASLVVAVKAGTWKTFPGLTPALQTIIAGQIPTAYSQAFKTVYLASLGFGAVAIIGSLFVIDAQPLLTDKVERRLHSKSVGGEKLVDLESKAVQE